MSNKSGSCREQGGHERDGIERRRVLFVKLMSDE